MTPSELVIAACAGVLASSVAIAVGLAAPTNAHWRVRCLVLAVGGFASTGAAFLVWLFGHAAA